MSQPFARHLHLFDLAGHRALEPEFKRAILASWASDRSAVIDKPALPKASGLSYTVPIDDILAALCLLDGEQARPTLQ